MIHHDQVGLIPTMQLNSYIVIKFLEVMLKRVELEYVQPYNIIIIIIEIFVG